MKITKETIKETLRSIMTEESEYAIFFKKALEKAGKSITDMSDEEKKAFFNKIDAAWDGKGEKNEELVGNQHKLDVDGDGEIEASDLAALRAKKDESLTEEEIKWNAVQNAIINFLKVNTKILDKRVQAKDTEGVKGGLNSIISGLTNAQRSLKLESVNEGKFKEDDLVYNKKTKTVGIVRMGDDKYGEVKTDADGNVSVDELEHYNPIKFKHQTKAKVAPSTEKEVNKRGLFNPFRPMESVNEDYDGPAILKTGDKNALKVGEKITINSGGKKKEYKVVKSNGNGDFVLHLVKESVNEEIKVGQMIKVDNPHWEAALGKKGPFKRKVKMIDGDNVFFTDGSNSSMKYIKEDAAVNEGVKLSLVDPNTNKFIKTLSLDRTYREAEKEIETLNRRLSPSQKTKGLYWKVTSIGESVNEYSVNKKFGSKYDIGAGSMGSGTTFWNRKEEEFGDYKKIAHVSDSGKVTFYDKTLPSAVKQHIEDYVKTQKESVNESKKMFSVHSHSAGSKKFDINVYDGRKNKDGSPFIGTVTANHSLELKDKIQAYKSKGYTEVDNVGKKLGIKYKTESVNEGRAFINAARKAKLEGKTEFEFNGKKYPVTIK
jgi:Ca2+-binding EF-hand superfamily protein